jgi:thiamine-phosphate pyrophosphorylase
MKNFSMEGIYCITDESHSAGRSNVETAEKMIQAGIKIIQYRDKDKSIKEKYIECKKIREMTKKAGVCFIVNDHADIAKAVDADGVHIGQDDLPVHEVRKVIGEDKIIGVSTHSPEQGIAAVNSGADYIGAGPVFKTYTKKDVCDPVGFEYLDFVVSNLDIPFVAIGGIKKHNLKEVISRGAKCAALVTEITQADDIEAQIKRLQEFF